MRSELTLEPVPSAAGVARRWAKAELADSAYTEFTDSAVLGLSELVTNAVLHVRSAILVRLHDNGGQLRVEVHDDSPQPPQGHLTHEPGEHHPPSTIGRGLHIVDSISYAWGVSYQDAGKYVWFFPTAHGTRSASRSRSWPDRPAAPVLAAGERVSVTLVDLPLEVFVHFRERFYDLQREMTLIALDEHRASGLAKRLIDVADQTADFRREGSGIGAQAEAALVAGADRATITVEVPRELGPVLLEFGELLVKANEYCQDRQLLTLAAGPQEQALRAWYLSELAAQIGGAEPTPWPGEFVVTDPSEATDLITPTPADLPPQVDAN